MTDPGLLPVRGASHRSRGVAFGLALLFGVFGAHRFYVGRTTSAVFQLLTLGGAGIWALVDCILIATGNFRDVDGRRVLYWDPQERDHPSDELPQEVIEEIDALHQHIEELTERLDFAERMLADPTRRPRADS
ncbi:MAG: TM2 domain-containing protein [Gemmatimonadales bacterium]